MLKIITTSDGSHSLLNEEINETYHSVHGAIQESAHVFIKNGLEYALQKRLSTPLRIFELGFGTGLNALLTWKHSLAHQTKIHYTSIEASPLTEETWLQLNYGAHVGMDDEFQTLHRSTWGVLHWLTTHFSLLKVFATLQQFEFLDVPFDLVYYDAFAPSKQPELWTPDILEKVFHGLKPGGTFVTYCAKGQFKRDLSAIGFEVETLAGPPGKKEMVRACRP